MAQLPTLLTLAALLAAMQIILCGRRLGGRTAQLGSC
jgi:hypothetical protein